MKVNEEKYFECMIGGTSNEWDLATSIHANDLKEALKKLLEELKKDDKPVWLIITSGESYEEAQAEMEKVLFPGEEEQKLLEAFMRRLSEKEGE